MVSPLVSIFNVRLRERIALLLALLAWLAGMFVDILEVDAAQYAMMSRDLLAADNWLEFYNRDLPYLDKPPLTFWMVAASFKLFGVGNFSYRLPSILFCLLTLGATYGLSRELYNKRIAFWALLITATVQGVFVMNFDVKTDMYLLGGVMLAVWQWTVWIRHKKWSGLVLGFIGVGIALLAKGPLGLVIPVLAIGPELLIRRDWKRVFDPRWLIGAPILAIMLWPMCMGLHRQFGDEGLRFYFWTQSFGRITGDSSWSNSAGPFFLLHTFAWAFLPFTLFFAPALVERFRQLFREKLSVESAELISFAGFLLPTLALSASRFKLPHYIFVVLPFAAIMTAVWLEKHFTEGTSGVKWRNVITQLGSGLAGLISAAGLLLAFMAFPPEHAWNIILLVLIGLIMVLNLLGEWKFGPVFIGRLALAAAAVNLCLNLQFYPGLLEYQGSSKAGQLIAQHDLPVERTYAFAAPGGYALDFYAGGNVRNCPDWYALERVWWVKDVYVYTSDEGLAHIQVRYADHEILETFPRLKVNRLKFSYLSPDSREEQVMPLYLVHLKRKKF